jgi:hypothetical protein
LQQIIGRQAASASDAFQLLLIPRVIRSEADQAIQ